MSEFVGRTGSNRVYSYPEPRRNGGSPSTEFARNFATGPKNGDPITTGGTEVEWNGIDSGPSPSVDVNITPAVTGIVRISGVITVANGSGAPVSAQLRVAVNGNVSPLPQAETVTVPASGNLAIPFLTETTDSDTPIGSTSTIEVQMTAGSNGALTFVNNSSSLDVQEVSVATG